MGIGDIAIAFLGICILILVLRINSLLDRFDRVLRMFDRTDDPRSGRKPTWRP